MAGRTRISADTRLTDCPERSIGISLPMPLSDRVDSLVAIVTDAGDRTSRKELLGAILLATRPDANGLATALRTYRRATARDAVLDAENGEQVVLRPSKPGPRPRRSR
jgi:hypothetical protein